MRMKFDRKNFKNDEIKNNLKIMLNKISNN